MTDQGDNDRSHPFSEGEGVDSTYEEFDLDPPELGVDPTKVDPVDSRVVTDLLDEHNIDSDDIDASELLDVGLNYMQINRFEQATEAFERTANFADDPLLEQEAWVNKGVAHSELEEWDEAIGAHREALRIDREAQKGTLDTEGAQREGLDAGSVSGQREQASSEHAATAHTNLAYALWEFGETSEALEHAERAVEIDERFPQAWYNRAFFLAERGLAEDALNCIDNAIRLGMRDARVLGEKAEILEELGKYDEAEEVADEANELRERAEEKMVEERKEGEQAGAGTGMGTGTGDERGDHLFE